MRFFEVENLKGLSTEDMDQLRVQIRDLDRRVRAELEGRERACAYCGQRVEAARQDLKYCSAWHRYLDAHRDSSPLSRVDFERERAVRRIRTLRKGAQESAADSAAPGARGIAELRRSLRDIRIRQVLSEFRAITGLALRKSLREHRQAGTSGN